jgi:cell division septal protein FtsQ
MRVRRVGYAALAVVVLSSPLWGPPLLRSSSFFAVRRVEVVGARYLPAETVAAALGLSEGASVFADLEELGARVGRVSGVALVRVARELPGTLRVEIREVEPVALAVGPAGLVPVSSSGRALPYDVTAAPVDAPVVRQVERALLEALATIQATDLALYAAVAAAQRRGGEVVLELDGSRVRLPARLDPEVVRAVATVRRDLEARGVAWLELDGRFRGWVVVRRAARGGGREDGAA